MIIKKKSDITGKIHVMDLPVTQEQLDRWYNGELIQRAMPNLTSAQREFLMTGALEEEYDELFRDEE